MCSFKREFFPEIAATTCPAPAGGGGGDPWCTYDNHLLTLVISSLYLSAFFACFVAADLARRFGRRVRRAARRRARRERARLRTTARAPCWRGRPARSLACQTPAHTWASRRAAVMAAGGLTGHVAAGGA
jgi:hypothetical protein